MTVVRTTVRGAGKYDLPAVHSHRTAMRDATL